MNQHLKAFLFVVAVLSPYIAMGIYGEYAGWNDMKTTMAAVMAMIVGLPVTLLVISFFGGLR